MRLAIALLLVSVTAPHAFAQKAEATAAFQRGQQLKLEGKVEEACAAFELSMKLDAQRGTQYNLALCYLDLGRTASAWAELNELSNVDPNTARRDDAAKRARELRPKLTSVVVIVADRAPQLAVTRDGIDITALVGTATPVDPGKHRYGARAPGRRPWDEDVLVTGDGATITVSVPKLEEVTAKKQDPPPPKPGGDVAAPVHVGRGRRVAGFAVGVAGLGGLAVGSLYGVRALSRGDDARRTCGGQLDACLGDVAAAELALREGRSAARISNVGFLVGGVLAATGIVLYATAPRRRVAAAPAVSPDHVGLVFAGRF